MRRLPEASPQCVRIRDYSRPLEVQMIEATLQRCCRSRISPVLSQLHCLATCPLLPGVHIRGLSEGKRGRVRLQEMT